MTNQTTANGTRKSSAANAQAIAQTATARRLSGVRTGERRAVERQALPAFASFVASDPKRPMYGAWSKTAVWRMVRES